MRHLDLERMVFFPTLSLVKIMLNENAMRFVSLYRLIQNLNEATRHRIVALAETLQTHANAIEVLK